MLCTIRSEEELAQNLSYELASYPTALFDGKSIRKDTKSSFISVIESLVKGYDVSIPESCSFVIDGKIYANSTFLT